MKVEIIKGADGPTSIFLASNTNWKLFVILVLALIALIVTIVVMYKRKKK